MENLIAFVILYVIFGNHGVLSGGKTTSVIGDGITDNSVLVQAANATTGSKPILFSGISVIGTATTITAPIADTMEQIFSTASQITINNGQPVRPEWFGSAAGNIRLAVNALPSSGGVVKLENKRYQPSYADSTQGAGGGWLAKQNVRIQGARLPEFMGDNSGLKDGSGTIINGPFNVFANGFEWDAAGVDSGVTVTDSLYGGAVQDAFDFFQPNKTTPIYATGVRIESIRGIGRSPDAAGHAVLLEAIDGGYVGLAEGSTAIHSVVIKSRRIMADTLRGFNCGVDCVIFKSDEYAPMENVTVEKVYAKGAGTRASMYGVLIQSATALGSKVNIGSIQTSFVATGVAINGRTSDINIGEVVADTVMTGVKFSGNAKTNINSVLASNCFNGIAVDWTTRAKSNYVGRITATNATNAVSADGYIHIGDVVTDNVRGYALRHNAETARIMLSGAHSNISGSTQTWGMWASLANNWANYSADNLPFSIEAIGGRVVMSGLIANGTSAIISTSLSNQIRPGEDIRFTALGYNGAVRTPIDLIVGSNGTITAANYTAASTWLSLDNISWPIPY